MDKLLETIKWEYVDQVETKQGKIKSVLIGKPTADFWTAYKADKDASKEVLRKLTITLGFEAIEQAVTTATGQAKKVGGRFLGKRLTKSWHCTLWINRRNSHIVLSNGFKLPESEFVDREMACEYTLASSIDANSDNPF